MNSELRVEFSITFHGPFRISTGDAGEGSDERVDPALLLPASSLKGLMRRGASAVGVAPELIDDTFGASNRPCPWAWTSATFSEDPVIRTRTRIAIDDETGVVAKRALLVAEEVWATDATFTVEQIGPLDLPERHVALLLVAASAVQAIGADRNRGEGWVSVAPRSAELGGGPPDRVPSLGDAIALLDLARAGGPG